jgi:GTPase Era involved in 16S rRNA processing
MADKSLHRNLKIEQHESQYSQDVFDTQWLPTTNFIFKIYVNNLYIYCFAERELRIALVGKIGVGKSATANTISGGNYFKSGVCAQAMTQICQQQKVTIFGQDISIIDTPGIFDTETDQNTVKTEIKRCVYLGSPGLHAILYVMEIGRFKQEDLMAIQTFLKFFKEDMKNRVIVVFTHGDKLLKYKQTLRDYLLTVPESLKTFLESCENRVILFNNDFNKEQSCEQVSGIITMIEALKKSNEISFYSDDMFKKAEERIQQREEEIRQTVEREYKEKMEEFERTTKINLRSEMMKERKDELENYKDIFDKRLNNVREYVRNEIKSKESKW